jgi:hypothetical protein
MTHENEDGGPLTYNRASTAYNVVTVRERHDELSQRGSAWLAEPSLVKLLRTTGLDCKLLRATEPGSNRSLRHGVPGRMTAWMY